MGAIFAALVGGAIAILLGFIFPGFKNLVAIVAVAAIATGFYYFWPIRIALRYLVPAIVIGMILLAWFLISPTYIGRLL